MAVLSLLAETSTLVPLELWPIAKDEMPARWLERLRNGSAVPVDARERSAWTDQTRMFESSDPEMTYSESPVRQVTGCKCEVGVETCLPDITSHNIILPSEVPKASNPSFNSLMQCMRSGKEMSDSWLERWRE